MRLDDYYEDDDNIDDYKKRDYKTDSASLTVVFAGIGIVILFTLVVILAINKKDTPSSSYQANKNTVSVNSSDKDDSYYISGDTRVASDLDFWDDYKEEPSENELPVSVNEILNDTKEDPSTDGKHTKIVYEDGTEEWVEINKGIPLNDYNFDNLLYKKPFMKYQQNSHVVSFEGVDISKSDEYVDFYALKNSGVDFVMIKLGQRGYSSGELSLDDNFEDNINRATAADLDVGVYFYSQAVSTEEAIEEAQFVINSISENEITYPVVYYIDPVNSMEARNDSVSQIQRTNYAIAFLDTIKDAGYYPMLYGSKEWLIKKYSLGTLLNHDYDFWLSEECDVPDYPYLFGMWRYSSKGSVDGIAGYANMNICFIDYSVR